MEGVDALAAASPVLHQHADLQSLKSSGESPLFLLSGSRAEQVSTVAVPSLKRAGEFSGRVLDLLVASLLLLLMLPLLAACALAVRLSGRGPVLFRHARIGRDGREFQCLKFRTMVRDADKVFQRILQTDAKAHEEWLAVQKLRNDPRVTFCGRFLRRYCLDELPQLFNVIAGDMSVVGPRPIVAAEISRYGAAFFDYCSVKPGLTGLWQVSGRHSLPYEQRVRLDAKYAQTKSVAADLLILWRTVPVVLLGLNQ